MHRGGKHGGRQRAGGEGGSIAVYFRKKNLVEREAPWGRGGGKSRCRNEKNQVVGTYKETFNNDNLPSLIIKLSSIISLFRNNISDDISDRR